MYANGSNGRWCYGIFLLCRNWNCKCFVRGLDAYRFLKLFQSSGVKMKELSIISQQKINGGGAIVYVISLVAVAAGYSVAKLLRKRFSITR